MSDKNYRGVIVAALTDLGLTEEPDLARRLADPSGDVAFDELEVDSLAAAELCIAIEDKTGVICDIGDLVLYKSVNALAAHLTEKSAGQAVG